MTRCYGAGAGGARGRVDSERPALRSTKADAPSSRQFKFLLNRPAPGKPIADPSDPQLERGDPQTVFGYGGLDDSFQSDILATFEFWTASTLLARFEPYRISHALSTTEVTSASQPAWLRAS